MQVDLHSPTLYEDSQWDVRTASSKNMTEEPLNCQFFQPVVDNNRMFWQIEIVFIFMDVVRFPNNHSPIHAICAVNASMRMVEVGTRLDGRESKLK